MRRFEILGSLLVLAALGCNGAVPGQTKAGSTAPASKTPTTQTPPSTSTPPSTTAPPTTSTTTTPSTPPKTGIPGVVPGTPSYDLEFKTGDQASKYAIYIPKNYTGAPTGVVLCLHGVEGGTTPTSFFQVAVFVGNNDRFIIVAPYGDVNDKGSGAWTQPYAHEILDLVRASYNVDPTKQYVAAISGGCLPGIWLALASPAQTWTTGYGNYTVHAGAQSEFAAVGFTSPAYVPSDPDFAAMKSMNATGLGFTPAFWTDYGALSSDGPRSQELADWATAHGYNPVQKVERPNEGHAPQPPFTFVTQMFDFFAAHHK